MKFRIFPTLEEKKKLNLMFDQYRWYYNSVITVFYNHYGHKNILNKKKYSFYTVRDFFRKYKYVEEEYQHPNNILNIIIKDYIYDENNKSFEPPWWKGQVHNRLPRGAVKKFVTNINSAISNFNNKNISHFKMKYMCKKNNDEYFSIEDHLFPAFIKKIKSRYFYTDKNRKRKTISFSDVINKYRGIEIFHDKISDKYFLHYPVDKDYFPEDDRRIDSQDMLFRSSERIIALDPGVRKFLVGYDPSGKTYFIGKDSQYILSALLLKLDKEENARKKSIIWKKIRHLVNDLHWKTIHFLVKNFDCILLPEFPVSKMIRGRKISRMTKRLMTMFCFYQFKTKLTWKCSIYNKKLFIVDESFTSKTCGVCGELNNVKGAEVFKCNKCGVEMDRDINGARNILLKHL